ncbi:MAG TPA: hypothetical protein DCS97_00365 [Planctomycetes bacterium]|nr:hypothetical protein [Planctomycetota bacterium]
MTAPRILIVEDEPYARSGLSSTLIALGHEEPIPCADLATARQAIALGGISLVLLDLHLPDGNGETLLEEIAAGSPGLPVLVITAAQEITTAVRCMRLGAADYLVKPVEPLALETIVGRVLATAAIDREHRGLLALSRSSGLGNPEAFADLITFDPGMIRLMRQTELIASVDTPVLISGEPGCGKKTLASAIHRLGGGTRDVPVVAAGMIATEAALDRSGTLVIDHLEDLPASGQAALLARLRRSGPGPRFLITTSVAGDQMVRLGTVRADLVHLLGRRQVHVPPLRERPGDVAVLIHHLAPRLAQRRQLAAPAIPDRFIRYCQTKDWPGNVTQLIAAIDTALTQGGGLDLVPAEQRTPLPLHPLPEPLPTLDQMRSLLIAEALRRSDGNLNEASRMLGISRWGLSKRLKQDH